MKKLTILSFAILFLVSCKKKTEVPTTETEKVYPTSISYPDSMIYGKNVLHIIGDTNTLTVSTDYSFGAVVGERNTLKLVLTNTSIQTDMSQPKPTWFYASENGWTVSNYTSDSQTFIANKDGEIVLNMSFLGTPGSCKIDYYENSDTLTKTKYLEW